MVHPIRLLQFLVGIIQRHPLDMYRHDISGTTTTGSYPTKTTSSSGATSVYDSTYYFMTTAHRIYKVLYNGDQVQTGASNISGSEPTSEQTGVVWHDANYYIKFMYSLTTSEVQNFLTTDFIFLFQQQQTLQRPSYPCCYGNKWWCELSKRYILY